jgi:hypothetical protein
MARRYIAKLKRRVRTTAPATIAPACAGVSEIVLGRPRVGRLCCGTCQLCLNTLPPWQLELTCGAMVVWPWVAEAADAKMDEACAAADPVANASADWAAAMAAEADDYQSSC